MIIQQPGVVLVSAGLEVQLFLGEKHLRCTHQVAGVETVCQKWCTAVRAEKGVLAEELMRQAGRIAMVYKLEQSSTTLITTRLRPRAGRIAQLWAANEEKHAIVIGDSTTNDHHPCSANTRL
jgi:hypothetical protein